MKEGQSFRQMFIENLRDNFTWRPVVILLGCFLIYLVNYSEENTVVFIDLLASWKFWFLLFFALLADACIRTLCYWRDWRRGR